MNIETPDRALAPGEVHVWHVPLGSGCTALEGAIAVLSAEERQRADRLRREDLRNRFITARGTLRVLLGRYCDVSPGGLRFRYGPTGKPALMEGQGSRGTGTTLHFNMAHSEDIALLALTESAPVGVDVERVRPLADLEALVRQFFSAKEAAALSNLPATEQQEAFFRLWTRKEALLKATGAGISDLLNQVEVSFLPGEPARVLSFPAGPCAHSEWSLVDLPITPCYAAALAVPVPDIRVSQFHIPPSADAGLRRSTPSPRNPGHDAPR